MKIISSGMKVLRIQKLTGRSSLKSKSIPASSASDCRNINPWARVSGVSTTSTVNG